MLQSNKLTIGGFSEFISLQSLQVRAYNTAPCIKSINPPGSLPFTCVNVYQHFIKEKRRLPEKLRRKTLRIYTAEKNFQKVVVFS